MSSTDTTTTATPEGTPQDAPAPAYAAPRRLVRTMDDRRLGGVCGGVARYVDVDVTVVRVVSVVAGLFTFPFSVIAYLLLWVLIPRS